MKKLLIPLLLFSTCSLAAPQPAQNGGTGVSNPLGTQMHWDSSVTFSGAFDSILRFPAGTDVTFPTNGTLAIDEDTVHTSGDEVIDGTKQFEQEILAAGLHIFGDQSNIVMDDQTATVGDFIGYMQYIGVDNVATPVTYGLEALRLTDNTAGSESASQEFVVKSHGDDKQFLALNGVNATVEADLPLQFFNLSEANRDLLPFPQNGGTIYNTDTQTLDFYDGVGYQQNLTIDHLIAGDNISVVDNGDGTATISSSDQTSSGAYTPTVTCISGCNTPATIKGIYSISHPGAGGVQTFIATGTFTATSTTGVVRVQCPSNPNFTAISQGGGTATIVRSAGAAIGDGLVATVDSQSGVDGLNLNWVVSTNSVGYQFTVSGQCLTQ